MKDPEVDKKVLFKHDPEKGWSCTITRGDGTITGKDVIRMIRHLRYEYAMQRRRIMLNKRLEEREIAKKKASDAAVADANVKEPANAGT